MNITRTKTAKPEVWNMNTGGVKIASASAKHSSPTVRAWNINIRVPLTNGKPVTGKIKNVFSIKQGEKQIEKFLKDHGVHVKDIKGYDRAAA